jgi:hypothetical protein
MIGAVGVEVEEGWCQRYKLPRRDFFAVVLLFFCNSHVKRSINVRMYVEDTKFDLTPLTGKVA